MGTSRKLLITLFFLSSVAAVFLTPFWLVEHKLRAISYSLGGGLIYLLILDGVFRLVVRIARGHPYQMRDKIPFKKMYVEPHPYLPYVLKKKILIQHKQPTNYPLDLENKYHFGQYYTNNLRHINGSDGSRDVVIPKPQCVTTKHLNYWNRIETLIKVRTNIRFRNLHKSYIITIKGYLTYWI